MQRHRKRERKTGDASQVLAGRCLRFMANYLGRGFAARLIFPHLRVKKLFTVFPSRFTALRLTPHFFPRTIHPQLRTGVPHAVAFVRELLFCITHFYNSETKAKEGSLFSNAG